MPNRILSDRICTSETLAELAWEEEVFFYRLIVSCDDYGRFDARIPVIRARCYPLALQRVSEKRVSGWLSRLSEAGLISVQNHEGRPYLQVTTWDRWQQIRSKKAKYGPPVGSDGNGNQLISSDIRFPRNPIQSNPNPTNASDIECTQKRSRAAVAVPHEEVPEELQPMDAIFRDWPGYKPGRDFLGTVSENYGHLDLREEAVKATEWLRVKGKRKCTTPFILNWLRNAAASYAARGGRNGRTQDAIPEPPEFEGANR